MLDSIKTVAENTISQTSNFIGSLGSTLVDASLGSINKFIGEKVPFLNTSKGFDIDQFTSEAIHQTDIQSPSLFLVEFAVTPLLLQAFAKASNSRYTLNSSRLSLFCMSTSLPSIFIMTDDQTRRYGYGPIHKTATGAGFIDQQFIFIADGYGIIHRFISEWMKGATHFGSPNGMNHVSTPYVMSYPSYYYTDIAITTFTRSGAANKRIVLQKAYPLSMAEVNLNWAERDGFVHIPTMFTFFDWYEESINNNGVTDLNGIPLYIKDSLTNIGSQFLYNAAAPLNNALNNAFGSVGSLLDNTINSAVGKIQIF